MPLCFNEFNEKVGAPDDSRRMQHQIGLQNMSKRGALALIADIVAAVYDCRSSRLSSGFGCKNNSHSSKANEALALLPSLVISPRIDLMSIINLGG